MFFFENRLKLLKSQGSQKYIGLTDPEVNGEYTK